jgi:hypothetical protein
MVARCDEVELVADEEAAEEHGAGEDLSGNTEICHYLALAMKNLITSDPLYKQAVSPFLPLIIWPAKSAGRL